MGWDLFGNTTGIGGRLCVLIYMYYMKEFKNISETMLSPLQSVCVCVMHHSSWGWDMTKRVALGGRAGFKWQSRALFAPLSKLPRPFLMFAQGFRADAWADRCEACLKVCRPHGSDLVNRHMEQRFAQRPEGPHGGVLRQGCQVRSRVSCDELVSSSRLGMGHIFTFRQSHEAIDVMIRQGMVLLR